MKQAAGKKKKPESRPLLEIADLRIRLEEAEETLRAIRRGEIDGLVVDSALGKKQVYTLKGADESYRTLVEAMSEGALIVAEDGLILYANRRFAEIVKCPLPRVIGSPVQEFVPADLLPAYHDLVSRSRTSSAQQEIVLRRPDRQLVPVQLSAGAMHLDETSCVGVLVTDLSDRRERETARATERKSAEHEIRRHVATLEATNRELEAFVYSVSHDLRAPLRSIHRFSTVINEDYGAVLDDTAKDYLARIAGAAERMDELIRDLLTYSQVSRQEMKLHAVQTESVVSSVLQQLDDELRDCGGEVQVVKPLPAAMGDALLLSQALTNLVSNGVKFVSPGVRPRIKVWGECRNAAVRLWIEDNGIGISPDEQSRLFRLFERIRQDFPGTGVGLAIVKRAVERMGGTVGVESTAGRGSRFWMDLRPLLSEGA